MKEGYWCIERSFRHQQNNWDLKGVLLLASNGNWCS